MADDIGQENGVATDLDDRINFDSVVYDPDSAEPNDVDQQFVEDGSSIPPMAVYQPWDSVFEDTDFHLQNPEDEDEVDTYSGHAGTAHVWQESQEESDEVVIVYEFDSTLSFGNYPSTEPSEPVNQDLELFARYALTEGDAGITVAASKENVESLVHELAELDERLLEEGHAEYNANLLAAAGRNEGEVSRVQSVDVVDTQFDSHQELYREKDRVEN